jgi:hypothetical protein
MHRQRLRPSASVRASISEDGLVLLDLQGGLVLSSNQVGARIWQLIDGERTLADIARQVKDDYHIPGERAERDTALFVAALVARGLVIQESRS